MRTQPCEVLLFYSLDGERGPDVLCGAAARIDVNGFPMCARHFHEYEDEDLIESVEPLTIRPPTS
jgi:hypothetical protein